MQLVKSDITKKNADEMVQYSLQIEAAMKDNENFVEPTPKLVDVEEARTALQNSIAPAANGDRVAVALRNTLRRALGKLLVELCQYVNAASKGDRDVALTSGFPPAKEPRPIGLVGAPDNLVAQATDKRGDAHLRWKSRYGSRMKQVFVCSGDPNVEGNWELLGVTTKSTFMVTDLDPNKIYWFRVNAVCAAGITGYSDPTWVRAAA
jgi:hypothetical protein